MLKFIVRNRQEEAESRLSICKQVWQITQNYAYYVLPILMAVCTWTAELFALDLADAFVRKPAGTGASSSTGLNRVVLQVVS